MTAREEVNTAAQMAPHVENDTAREQAKSSPFAGGANKLKIPVGTKTKPVGPSHPLNPLRWMTRGRPTNYNMLLFRTMNREMGLPSAHDDKLAPLLRDALMPLRCGWFKKAPGAWRNFHAALEHPKLGAPGLVNYVDARTQWFDEAVRSALRTGICQVVAVAAGFDTRAYRFGSLAPGVTFFEVDLPHASHKKQQLVERLFQPADHYPRPHYIAANLATTPLDQVLSSCPAFQPGVPTLFTVEGLVYYLPQQAVQTLLSSMALVAGPGSMVYFDFLHKSALDGVRPLPPAYKVTAQSVANKGEPFISGLIPTSEHIQAFLDSCGSARSAAASAARDVDTSSSGSAHMQKVPKPVPVIPPATAAAAGGAAGAGAAVYPVQPPAAAQATKPEMEPTAAAATVDACNPGAPAAVVGAHHAAADSGGLGKPGMHWVLSELLSPQQQLRATLPHVEWNAAVPPILSFYSYAAATLHAG